MKDWLKIDIEAIREDYLQGYYDYKEALYRLVDLGLTELEAEERLKF